MGVAQVRRFSSSQDRFDIVVLNRRKEPECPGPFIDDLFMGSEALVSENIEMGHVENILIFFVDDRQVV